jgi:hypothetical protein
LQGTSCPRYNGYISEIPVKRFFAGKRQITHFGLGVKQARCICFWLPLGQTDRNTCMVSVTIFFRIFTGFFDFLPVLDHFDDELGGEDKRIESQSWGGPFDRHEKELCAR